MDELGELAIGLVIVVSLFGVVLPVLPGLALEVVAIVIWAVLKGSPLAWGVAIAAFVIGAIGTYVKYAVPKRRLNEVGIPNRTLLLATAAAIVGVFAIPGIGAPIGFVAAIYLSERSRVGRERAWPSTRSSLGAVATSIGIELAAGMVIAAIWFLAVILA
jgi:hypothetical protein